VANRHRRVLLARKFSASKSERGIESVAVLPFENTSGNADSDYLSDGLAESLIYRLSQVPNLKVTPRSSVFRYKGKAMDREKIGEELGVDAVMSGRLIQRGDDLIISVDLIDVRNKKTLWGDQFQRKMSICWRPNRRSQRRLRTNYACAFPVTIRKASPSNTPPTTRLTSFIFKVATSGTAQFREPEESD
jgi:TolB-like protein